MKDEIKEILEDIKDMNNYSNFIDSQYGGKNYYYLLEKEESKQLLDYITNLQDRIKELEQINEEHRELNGKLREENESFKEYVKTYLKSKINRKNEELELVKTKLIEEHNKCYDYKTRNEKAIEYIEQDYDKNEEVIDYCNFDNFYKNVVKILKGE